MPGAEAPGLLAGTRGPQLHPGGLSCTPDQPVTGSGASRLSVTTRVVREVRPSDAV